MNKAITAIIIDDEYHCIENLVHYLNELCPRINIVGSGTDGSAFRRLVNEYKPEVAFLDIHLMGHTIFDALGSESATPVPVFVTAYADHALSAFKVNALDYLLKPLEAKEISRCYDKICHYFDGSVSETISAETKKIKLREGDEIFLTTLSEVLLLKASGFYTEVYFKYKMGIRQILLSKPLSSLCEEWNHPDLLRIHRSFAVNLRKIENVYRSASGISVQIAGHTVPISKSKFEEFRDRYRD